MHPACAIWQVTQAEFQQALQKFGIHLNAKQGAVFFSYFDDNNSGTITSNEFVKQLYGKNSK